VAGGNEDGRFFLDSSTGRLSCAPLDRELVAAYNLSITAIDNGSPAQSSVTVIGVAVVDDNDNDPIFQQVYYSASVPENSPVGTTVLTLVAFDLDEGLNGNVTYSLSNAADGVFDVDQQTGVVTLLM
jgi:protocadherin-16/23